MSLLLAILTDVLPDFLLVSMGNKPQRPGFSPPITSKLRADLNVYLSIYIHICGGIGQSDPYTFQNDTMGTCNTVKLALSHRPETAVAAQLHGHTLADERGRWNSNQRAALHAACITGDRETVC